jgi:hypothetical protein
MKEKIKKILGKIVRPISPTLARFIIKHFRPLYYTLKDIGEELGQECIRMGWIKGKPEGFISGFFRRWLNKYDRRIFDPQTIEVLRGPFLSYDDAGQYDRETEQSVIDKLLVAQRKKMEKTKSKARKRRKSKR